MSDDEMSFSMSVPLDSDGFLRRECPTCEREFKWLAAQDDDDLDSGPSPDAGYLCPYCGVRAPPDAWHTKAQLEQATAIIMREVVEPEIKKLSRSVERLNRQGGFVQASLESDVPQGLDDNAEDDGMRRVDSPCHPDEPVKVDEAWGKTVHCLLCGTPA